MANDKKTILITGASRGIGAAVAAHFVKQGWNVAGSMRSPENAGEWAKADNAFALKIDVTSTESIKQGVQETINRFGKIDVLYNNAGVSLIGVAEAASQDAIDNLIQVNVASVIHTTNTVLPFMRKQGGGLIMTASSISGLVPTPGVVFYVGTKFAMEGMMEAWRYELSLHDIRVKLLEFGPVASEMTTAYDLLDHEAYETVAAITERMNAAIDRVIIEPEEAARQVYEAACDPSERLRYRINIPWAIVFFKKFLPDFLWNRGMRRFLNI